MGLAARWLAVLGLPWLFACSGEADEGPAAPPPSRPTRPVTAPEGCEPGQFAHPDGGCCDAGSHAIAGGTCCPAGTFGTDQGTCCEAGTSALADGSCQPAGIPPELCGEGFEPTDGFGCEPVLPADPCPDGQHAIPGDAECHELAPCGSGPWGDIPVAADTQYVDGAYSGGNSDGSAGAPWTTVQAGIDAAEPDAIVAVAAGSYAESLLLSDKPVRLWGRCPSQTEVASDVSPTVLVSDGAHGSELHQLAISGSGGGVLALGVSGIVLEDVWIHDTGLDGLHLRGPPGSCDVTVRDCLVERARQFGLYARGCDVELERSSVRETLADSDGNWGWGIMLNRASDSPTLASARLQRCVVEQSRGLGLGLFGVDAVVQSTVVRSTETNGQGQRGEGVVAQSEVDAERTIATFESCLIEHNHNVGLLIFGAAVELVGTAVRTTEPDDLGRNGRGIVVQQRPDSGMRGALSARDSRIELSHDAGVFVDGSDARLERVVVSRTEPTGSGPGGMGLIAGLQPSNGERASVTVQSSVIEHNHYIGVSAYGVDLILERTAVRDTQPHPMIGLGRGVEVAEREGTSEESRAVVRSCRIERNHEIGLLISGSQALLEDTWVHEIAPAANGFYGRGVQVQFVPLSGVPSSATLSGCRVDTVRELALGVMASTATVERTALLQTAGSAFNGILGDGLAAVSSLALPVSVTVTASLLQDNARAGMASFGASVSLSDTALECNVLQLNGERDYGLLGEPLSIPFMFDDLGGNRCGCGDLEEPCTVLSSGLVPPAP